MTLRTTKPPTKESLLRTLEQTLAEVLASRGDREALEELRGWLDEHRSSSVGGTAFRILLERTPPAEHRRLIEEGLRNHHYYPVRERALEAAMRLGDPSLHPIITGHLYDPSDKVQRAARDAVMTFSLDRTDIVQVIMDIIRATDPPAASEEDVPCEVTPLPFIQLDDTEVQKLKSPERARLYAIECVCRPNQIPDLADVLLTLLDRDVPLLRFYAGHALAFVSDVPTVMQELIKRLDADRDVKLQQSALSALGRLRQPDALPVFQRYLDLPDLQLQRGAVVAIGNLPDHAGQDLLEGKWHGLHMER